jgi:hypothetical protein
VFRPDERDRGRRNAAHVDGHDMHFACANKKATQSPAHYYVHCTHEHRSVSFTFFPYGF